MPIRRRSPIPPQNLLGSPSQRPFLPPSHYAAAAGISYPPSLKVPRSAEEFDDEPSTRQVMTPTPQESVVSISYPSQTLGSEPFAVGAGTRCVLTPSPRPKRKSNLGDLPLLEAHLLPSLRDTIDRMTRPPARRSSSASSCNDSSAYDKRLRSASLSTTESGPVSLPPVKPPSMPQPSALNGPLSPSSSARSTFSANCTPIETSTPRQKPKAGLKSALKASTPKLHMPRTDDMTKSRPTSPAISLRSARGIMGISRKTPTPTPTIPSIHTLPTDATNQTGGVMSSLAKLHAKSSKGHEREPVTHAGRTRSRTDPGTSSVPFAPQKKPPATPQPYFSTAKLTPRTERLPKPIDDSAAESELEYRFEIEARDKRRLVVTNANVVPSSSESEVEHTLANKGFKTRLPVFTGKWELANRGKDKSDHTAVGLGFDFSKKTEAYPGKFTPNLMNDDDDDSSVYDEHEPELDKTVDSAGYSADHSCFSSQSRSSIDRLDEAHRRRREALLGIVNDLEAGIGTPLTDVCKSEESDYCGQEGLAIGGSGDVSLNEARKHTPTVPSHNYNDTTPRICGDDSYYKPNAALAVSPDDFLQDSRARPGFSGDNIMAVPFRATEPGFDTCGNSPLDKRKASRSPIIRRGTDAVLPAALRRYSVYDAFDPTAIPGGKESVTVEGQWFHAKNTTPQGESLQSMAARERKSLGIPSSDSDRIFQRTGMVHADSVLSSVDSALSLQGSDELSFGAEELFRKLSGKSDLTSFGQSSDDGAIQANVLPSRSLQSTWRNSPARLSNASSHYTNTEANLLWRSQEDATAPETQNCGGLTASFSTASGDLPQEGYGELEMQRQEVVRDLWETENTFVERMKVMVTLFVRPLRVKNTRIWISGIPPDVARLFDWLEDILNLHRQIFSVLQTSLGDEQPPIKRQIATSLGSLVARFDVYQPYMVRIGDVTEIIQMSRQESSSDFGEFVRIQERSPDCRGWNLERFLTEPLNRVTSYPGFFGKLRDVTPKDHTDYLPTLSLFCSTNLVMKVLDEVKLREDQYSFVKDILSRVQGLHPGFQLAKRDRRLLAHGILQRVEDSHFLKSFATPQTRVPNLMGGIVQQRTDELVESITDRDTRRGRAGSVKSMTSSATGTSTDSRSSTSSSGPYTPSSECFPSRFGLRSPSPKSKVDPISGSLLAASDGYSEDHGIHIRPRSRSNVEARSTATHAFVFSDIVVFTSPVSPGQDADVKWTLLDDIGVVRVLDVKETSESSGSFIVLDLLSVELDSLDGRRIPTHSLVKSVSFMIPGDARRCVTDGTTTKTGAGMRQKWLSALEQCSQSTTRLLSYSPLALNDGTERNGSRTRTSVVEHATDARCSLQSILASGLPIPKSPSFQKEEEAKGVVSDTAQMEREERGWWTLRFQQVLREIQRMDGWP